VNLYYRKLGKGKPLFILHGLFGSSDNWQTLAKRFAEHFEVYLIDQRNHGLSFHSDEWTYADMSEDILNLTRTCGLEKIYLLGHSMGGKAAMHFAMQHADKLEKLIVVDISPRYYPVHHQSILDALYTLDLSKITSRKEAESELSQKIKNPGELQFLLKNLYWKDAQNKELAWRFNLAVIKNNIEIVGEAQDASLNPVRISSLFIKGEKSNYIGESDVPVILKSFPNSKIETIPDAGHWVQAEKPSLFYESCLDFLS
jgi:pimeloyl-ACP methyl ester carboxylesterase